MYKGIKKDYLTLLPLVMLTNKNYQNASCITYNVSMGLRIDVLNGKTQLSNFFIGTSVLFGKFERLMFTAGASIRNVQQLQSGYQIGSNVTTSNTKSFLIEMYKAGNL